MDKLARRIYEAWRSKEYNAPSFSMMSAETCFMLARRIVSMADAEIMRDLKAQAASIPVKKCEPDIVIPDREEADGVLIEDDWGIL